MKIFLTGGTGFVGSHMLRRLLREGHEVRALVRRPGSLALATASAGKVSEIEGSLSSLNLSPGLDGCDAVMNLVGIIYEQGGSTFEAVHHQGTKNLVEAAQGVGIRRFVQMSALGARPGDASQYHTSKFAGEEEVRGSGISWTILRPSLIFGPGSGFVKQMADVMRSAPIFRPVPGTGEYRFRPVHVTDVVECFVQSLTSAATTRQTVDLVGGEELTLNEISDAIASSLGVRKKIMHVPLAFMKAAAAVFAVLPGKPPITSGQLRMLEEGSTADHGPMRRIFGIEPTGFRDGLRKDLFGVALNS